MATLITNTGTTADQVARTIKWATGGWSQSSSCTAFTDTFTNTALSRRWIIPSAHCGSTTTTIYQCEDDWHRLDDWVSTSSITYQEMRIVSPMERLRAMIDARTAPLVLTGRKSLAVSTDVREIRARETLRRMLGEDKYRLFIKNGFVSVRGSSGRVYQIFPDHQFTRVFENGKCIEQLCVVLNDSYPPTDSLLMRYCILLNDEEHFCRLSNRHRAYDRARLIEKAVDPRPLPMILADLKSGHHAASTVKTWTSLAMVA